MLPEAVLKTAQAELLDYHGSGMSVMEMSHRSKWFDEIITNTEAAMRRVLNIPDNYKVGFFQGGATQQFAMVPLNFMTTGTADYLVTGNFSKKAAEEAAKFGTARIAASSKDKNKEVKESIINAYEIKTGMSRAKLARLMEEETWMNAKKAVELGDVYKRQVHIKTIRKRSENNVFVRYFV